MGCGVVDFKCCRIKRQSTIGIILVLNIFIKTPDNHPVKQSLHRRIISLGNGCCFISFSPFLAILRNERIYFHLFNGVPSDDGIQFFHFDILLRGDKSPFMLVPSFIRLYASPVPWDNVHIHQYEVI